MSAELTDPREIRKMLRIAAYRGDRIDGGQLGMASMASTLARYCLHMAEAQGFSGEDAMTLLAYHALLRYERATDDILMTTMMTPKPFVILNPAERAKPAEAK